MELIIGIIIGICLCQINDRLHVIKKIKGLIKKFKK